MPECKISCFMHLNGFIFVCTLKINEKILNMFYYNCTVLTCTCALNKKIKYMQLALYCDLESHDSLYFSMHLRDVLIMHTYIQTRFQKSWDTVQIVNKNRMQ